MSVDKLNIHFTLALIELQCYNAVEIETTIHLAQWTLKLIDLQIVLCGELFPLKTNVCLAFLR